MTKPKIFISYSWDSETHKDWVFELSERLREDGLECITDHIVKGFPPEGWIRWMENQIEEADFVLVVCTPLYLQRFRAKDTGGGRGVTLESAIIGQTLYDAHCQNTKFIAVIPEAGNFDDIPRILKIYGGYSLPNQYDDLCRILTNQPEYIPSPVSPDIKPMPPKKIK